MIALLQSHITHYAGEQQRLSKLVKDLQDVLDEKQDQITGLNQVVAVQQQSIDGLREKTVQQQKIISDQQQLITEQDRELKKNKKDLARLVVVRHELRVFKKMLYGRRSEKLYSSSTDTGEMAKVGKQLCLDLDVETVEACHIKEVKKIASHLRVVKEKQPHPGRHGWPEGLDEEVTTLDVEDKPEGAVMVGVSVQKQLACRPMKFFLKVTRRPVYIIPTAEKGTFKQWIAPLPVHPIPKCKADVSVLVMLVIDKFLYHLPVYRQQQRLRQYGISLKYNTLSNWCNRICDILEPLYTILRRELLISRYLQMDETRYRVLDNEKVRGKKSHMGYLWAVSNPVQRIVAFYYQKGRGRKDAAPVLDGYSGYLQTDGYGVYTHYGRRPGVIHLQCLAHARRYFAEARGHDLRRSDHALKYFFAPLYAIEEQCKQEGLSYDQITERRQQQAVPVLNNLYAWLQQQLPQVTPRTPIHKAIMYLLNRRKELGEYTSDGMLQIDNNFTEQQIRPVTLGRKNHLFAGSHRGGQRAAIIYSLLGSCRLQGIDPARWLDDVLRRLPVHPEDKLGELLPQCWKPLEQNVPAACKQAIA